MNRMGSVLNYTYPNKKLIIVDNAEPDARNLQVKIIRNLTNLGFSRGGKPEMGDAVEADTFEVDPYPSTSC